MSDVTDADRERAAAILLAAANGRGSSMAVDAIAQALADEREKARAPFLAVADDCTQRAAAYAPIDTDHAIGKEMAYRNAADRIRRAAEESGE